MPISNFTVTGGELQALALVNAHKGVWSNTEDPYEAARQAGDQIIALAERIKAERAVVAMEGR